MNNKGFTLIELVVVLVILALVSGIGVISYKNIFKSVEENYYHTLENNLKISGNEYYKDHRDELPVDGYSSVALGDLIDNHYIEPIKDTNGNECRNGNVYVYYGDNNKYEYEVFLQCGDYKSDEDNLKH